tara:strand:+ start:1384 stop:1641 length:258 start_codon:yes stop_codon:yes gene_type:complete
MNSGMSNDDREIAMTILQGMTGYFRSCLARNLAVKNVPMIDFFYDDWEEQLKAMDKAVEEEQAELESIKNKAQESSDTSVEEPDK